MTNIGVIIVDYQFDPLLDIALTALSTCSLADRLKVIVIENKPSGQKRIPPDNLDVDFFPQEGNLGFGRAANLARLKFVTPYLFVLNPDIQVFPETLSVLHEYMRSHPEVGLLVPKLLNTEGSIQCSSRTFYTLSTILLRRTPLGRLFPNHPILRKHLMLDWDHNSIKEIDWALGACMLIRAEAVGDEIFDPRFFLYFEDVDLCLRLKKKGWKVVYHPEAVAIHAHRQKSRKSFFSRANYEHFVSWIKFMAKYKSTHPSAK